MRFTLISRAGLILSTITLALASGVVYSASTPPDLLSASPLSTPGHSLRPRVFRTPPSRTVIKPWQSSERIILKFAEGSEVRLRNGHLVSLTGHDLKSVNQVFAHANIRGSAIRPLIDRPEGLLANEKAAGEKRSGKQLADLSLYYLLETGLNQNPEQICDALNALDLVESAFPQDLPAPPPANNPDTPDFTDLQGYKQQLAGGIGVDIVASVPGVDGTSMTFADIEYDWVLDHEDLMLPESINTDPETIFNPYPPANHGTAVLSVLVAKDNGFGITGIVPAANALVFPTSTDKFKYNPGRAINRAAAQLQPGDIMLLEIQTWVCGTGEYGPAEWSQVVFDVVENATALGLIVVAPAGNGNVDLNQPACNGLFDRQIRDSGVIIVGAGTAGSNSKTSFSSYGSRVDVQAWGDRSVVTAGYGALYNPVAGDVHRMYTHSFSGTSSASPIVAGAAIAIQGALRASGNEQLDSYSMRALLRETGTPQSEGLYSGNIGPMPNVPAALARLFGWYAIDINPHDENNYIDTAQPDDSVSVAVLSGSFAGSGFADFDPGQLNYATVRFGPGHALAIGPISYTDIDADGDIDAELQFSIGDSEITCEDTSASFVAETHTGFPVQGSNPIQTPECTNTACHP